MADKPTINDTIKKDEFLTALYSISLRVEKQLGGKEALENFVQIIDFAALVNVNTQIIYGRNGTGKTHLLIAFYQYAQTNFNETRIIPIYIDFKKLALGPYLPSISVNDLIIRFYRSFIGNIAERLKEFADQVITISRLEQLFGGEGRDRKRSIEASLNEIDTQLNFENFDEMVKQYTRKVILDREGSSKTSGGISAGAKLSIDKPELHLGSEIGVSTEELSKDKETIELVYEGLGVIDYRIIQAELENIIEQCGANSIILLIDEWASVQVSIQPLLADMILRTIGVSNKIFLKIAALKYYTRTSSFVPPAREGDPTQPIGFQLGSDITVLADLDQILNFDSNPEGVKYFLTKVAHKHCSQILPKLKDYTTQDFQKYLEDEIFSDQSVSPYKVLSKLFTGKVEEITDKLEENGIQQQDLTREINISVYDEAVRASEGNPRDFLGILSSCSTRARLNPENKIRIFDAVYATSGYFNANKLPLLQDNPDARDLYNKIFQRVVKTKQKLFLVGTEKAEKDRRILELWHFRFIHLVNSSFMVLDKDSSPIEYSVFSMDYGRLLSLKANKDGETSVQAITTLLEIAFRMGMIPIDTSRLLKFPAIEGVLKHTLGTTLASLKGIEVANLANVDYLVQNCVIDDLLT